jgi:hypothetical protein
MPQIGRTMRLHLHIAMIMDLAQPTAREAVSSFSLASGFARHQVSLRFPPT